MRIDHKLNLTIPVVREGGDVVHVFSSPLERSTFEKYHLVIGKAFTQLFAHQLSFLGGPRVAAMILKDTALSLSRPDAAGLPSNWWVGPDGVELGLVAEIRRKTVVMTPTAEAGWSQLPYDEALKRDVFTEEEASEVEGAVTFFILNSAMLTRVPLAANLESAAGLWGWQTTSSPFADWRSSLMTSIEAETTQPKEAASSITISAGSVEPASASGLTVTS